MINNAGQLISTSKVNKWVNIIQDSLFPPSCFLCAAKGVLSQDLCLACKQELPGNSHHCAVCAIPLTDSEHDKLLCGKCQTARPAYDSTLAPFLHQGAIRYFIHQLKYRKQLQYARLLAALFIEQNQSNFSIPDFIIPVPLHRQRLQERGFNQSQEISRMLARHYKVTLAANVCVRTRNTAQQTGLSKKERAKNLRHAFEIKKPLINAHVAVFDDVITTGSTMQEISLALKQSGVKTVQAWCCARTPY